jgi:hypothetical protein
LVAAVGGQRPNSQRPAERHRDVVSSMVTTDTGRARARVDDHEF